VEVNAYLYTVTLVLNVTGQIHTPATLRVVHRERNIGGQRAILNMIVAQHHHTLCNALPCGIYKRMYEHPKPIMSY
jgi:hypothetical protein